MAIEKNQIVQIGNLSYRIVSWADSVTDGSIPTIRRYVGVVIKADGTEGVLCKLPEINEIISIPAIDQAQREWEYRSERGW